MYVCVCIYIYIYLDMCLLFVMVLLLFLFNYFAINNKHFDVEINIRNVLQALGFSISTRT